MPELPEVETIVRTLKPQIQGKTIRSVRVLLSKAMQYGAERLPLISGARILEVSRRAKLLVVGLGLAAGHKKALPPARETQPDLPGLSDLPGCLRDADLLLVFHLKMTGSFFMHPQGAEPLPHTRLVFDLGDAGNLFFDDMRTFGYCRIMLVEELPAWPFWASLGPEPLGMSPERLAAHFATQFAQKRSSIKSVLLDQRVVAGVGNIYADESLFSARIDPRSKAGAVPFERLLALAGALQAVLRQSIEECGSSIRDYRDALGNAGAFQNSFAVYGRKDEVCKVCGHASLQGCKLSGRGTVFCPVCQTYFE